MHGLRTDGHTVDPLNPQVPHPMWGWKCRHQLFSAILHKWLEHSQTMGPMRVLELIPCRYWGMTVPINEHYGKGAKMCGQVITFFFKISIKSESVSCSVVSDSAIPWTIARQAPLSMEFSRQENWSGLSFPSPGDSSQSRDEAQVSCSLSRFFTFWATREALCCTSK